MPLPADYVPAHTLHEPLTGDPAAPVVVLGSSIGTTSLVWQREVQNVRREFRVITCEHPGHGAAVASIASSAQPVPAGPYRIADLARSVLRILDLYEIRSAHLVGLSLGGAVAQWLGIHEAPRVESLSVVCSAASFPPSSLWTDRAAAVRAAGTVATPEISAGIPERWLTAGFRAANPEVVADLITGLGEVDPAGYAGCCEALAVWDATGSAAGGDDIATISAPTLLVAGDADPATPVSALVFLRDRIPGARLEVVAASHLAPVEVDLSNLLIGHIRSANG